MSTLVPGGVLVARSDGLGAGRFLGRSLRDPLANNRALVGLAVLIVGERRALDFLFARDGGTATEVVRCHFDASGRPRSCEVWHLDRRAPNASLDTTDLASLLDADEVINGLDVADLGVWLRTATGVARAFCPTDHEVGRSVPPREN